jgi:hypothetical protein
MAVELTATDETFTGTGVSSTYAAPIYANDDDQIKVYVNDVLKTLGDDYVLNGLGSATGISIVAIFPSGSKVYVERVTPIKQEVDTQNNETILEDVLDGSLDKLTLIAQELASKTGRALLVPKGENGITLGSLIGAQDGDLLSFIDGVLAIYDRSAFAGKFYVGDTDGRFVPSNGTGADAALRTDLASGIAGLGTNLVRHRLLSGASRGAQAFLNALPLMAENYGVIGDGVADDTAAAQAFLDLCTAQQRVANFGRMRVRHTSRLHIHNIGCLFDTQTFAASGEQYSGPLSNTEPGFYPDAATFAALPPGGLLNGKRVAVLVTGAIPCFRAACIGSGWPTFDGAGNITGDTRPDIIGFQFGQDLPPSGPHPDGGTMIISNIDYVRAVNMAQGVRVVSVFDSSFYRIHTETCGNASKYAIDIVQSDLEPNWTTNESVFHYLQAEFAANKAINVDPSTLSCTFSKIHSERAAGKNGVACWQLRGDCVYASVRLQARNGLGHSIVGSNNQVHLCTRQESGVMYVDALAGTTVMLGTNAPAISPVMNQTGRVILIGGGSTYLTDIGQNWLVEGFTATTVTITFTPGNPPRFKNCRFTNFSPTVGQTVANAALDDCDVTSLTWATTQSLLVRNSRVTFNGNIAYSSVTIDGSDVAGDIGVDGATVIFTGNWRLAGNLTAVFSPTIQLQTTGRGIGGSVIGWSAAAQGAAADGVLLYAPRPAVGEFNAYRRIGGAWVGVGTI